MRNKITKTKTHKKSSFLNLDLEMNVNEHWIKWTTGNVLKSLCNVVQHKLITFLIQFMNWNKSKQKQKRFFFRNINFFFLMNRPWNERRKSPAKFQFLFIYFSNLSVTAWTFRLEIKFLSTNADFCFVFSSQSKLFDTFRQLHLEPHNVNKTKQNKWSKNSFDDWITTINNCQRGLDTIR